MDIIIQFKIKEKRKMGLEFEDFKRRRVEGAILAFIRGKKNLNWVMGIIKGKWGIKRHRA
jgi:DNA-directed RNA polymerase specialized sigma subunit